MRGQTFCWSDSKRDKNSVNAQKKLITQEDSMDTPEWVTFMKGVKTF